MPHTRHRALLPAVLATVLLAAGVPTHGQKPGAAAITFDRYHTPRRSNVALAAMNKANPTATALHAIATSPGGIVLTALEIGPEAGQKVRKLPAVFVVGNLEGVLPIAAEAALNLADRLLQNPAATKTLTWFILPNANPDAAARFGGKPLAADERNATRHNDDMDDQVDEDGPDDLDGNGVITEMRVKDPAGEWIPVDGEPRLMRKADPAKGERGVYKLYQEGIDNDGDGEIQRGPRRRRQHRPHLPAPVPAVDADGRAVAGQRARDVRHREVRDRPPGNRDDGRRSAPPTCACSRRPAAAWAPSTRTRSRSPRRWRRSSVPIRPGPTP